MNSSITPHSKMEEVKHSNWRLPVAEFIDEFDDFPQGSFPDHWHDEFELQVALRGSAEYRVNGQPYTLEEGWALYIAPDAIHTAKQLRKGSVGYNILISPRLLINVMNSIDCDRYTTPLFTRRPDACLISPQEKNGHRIIESLRALYYTEATESRYELLVLESLVSIWRNLLTIFSKQELPPEDDGKHLREQRMRTMVDYIHQHFSQPISIQDIARSSGISKSECFRCFAGMSNMTPLEYLNEIRLLHACRLLTTTTQSVSEICYATGFSGASYFSKRFKEQYGVTPKEYRAKNTGRRPSEALFSPTRP